MGDAFIPFSFPSLDHEEWEEVREVLTSGWITTGSKTKELEAEFAKFVGARHAVAVNSCTAAMHLALEAVGIRAGDEIIVPTMTFAATAGVVEQVRARPVLVDCQPDTLTMDPELVRQAVTERTRAIIPVHYGGHPCEMDALREIAATHQLHLIEDAAHALPARYKGQMIGASRGIEAQTGHQEGRAGQEMRPGSTVVCFSFYATKNLTTGEGGMLCIEQEELVDRARIMSLHGMSRDAWKRYTSEGSWYYEVVQPGYKYNLPDLLAAIGLAQLRKLPRFQQRRRAIVAKYLAAFSKLEAIDCPIERPGVEHAWHLFVIRLRLDRLKITRNQFIDELRQQGIGTSVHFIPLHRHPYYRQTYGYRADQFPVASEAFERIISLPLYPAMTDEAVERVIQAVTGITVRNRIPPTFGHPGSKRSDEGQYANGSV